MYGEFFGMHMHTRLSGRLPELALTVGCFRLKGTK